MQEEIVEAYFASDKSVDARAPILLRAKLWEGWVRQRQPGQDGDVVPVRHERVGKTGHIGFDATDAVRGITVRDEKHAHKWPTRSADVVGDRRVELQAGG